MFLPQEPGGSGVLPDRRITRMRTFLLGCLLLPWILLGAQAEAAKSTTVAPIPFTTAIPKTVTYHHRFL
jgi:hypothetical protein